MTIKIKKRPEPKKPPPKKPVPIQALAGGRTALTKYFYILTLKNGVVQKTYRGVVEIEPVLTEQGKFEVLFQRACEELSMASDSSVVYFRIVPNGG